MPNGKKRRINPSPLGGWNNDTFLILLSFLAPLELLQMNPVNKAVRRATQKFIEYTEPAGGLIFHSQCEKSTPLSLRGKINLWGTLIYQRAGCSRAKLVHTKDGVLPCTLVVHTKTETLTFEATTTTCEFPIDLIVAPLGSALAKLGDVCLRLLDGKQCCRCYHPQMRHGPPFWRCCCLLYFLE